MSRFSIVNNTNTEILFDKELGAFVPAPLVPLKNSELFNTFIRFYTSGKIDEATSVLCDIELLYPEVAPDFDADALYTTLYEIMHR